MEQRNALLVQQIVEGVQSALPQQSAAANTDELTSEVANVASVVNQQSQVIPQLMQQMQKMQQMQQMIQQMQGQCQII